MYLFAFKHGGKNGYESSNKIYVRLFISPPYLELTTLLLWVVSWRHIGSSWCFSPALLPSPSASVQDSCSARLSLGVMVVLCLSCLWLLPSQSGTASSPRRTILVVEPGTGSGSGYSPTSTHTYPRSRLYALGYWLGGNPDRNRSVSRTKTLSFPACLVQNLLFCCIAEKLNYDWPRFVLPVPRPSQCECQALWQVGPPKFPIVPSAVHHRSPLRTLRNIIYS